MVGGEGWKEDGMCEISNPLAFSYPSQRYLADAWHPGYHRSIVTPTALFHTSRTISCHTDRDVSAFLSSFTFDL